MKLQSSLGVMTPRLDYSRQNILVHILVYSQIFLKDVWGYNIPVTGDDTKDNYVNRKLCFHDSGHIFKIHSQPSVVLPVECPIPAKDVCLDFVQKFFAVQETCHFHLFSEKLFISHLAELIAKIYFQTQFHSALKTFQMPRNLWDWDGGIIVNGLLHI